jgi:hypothetical protein
LVLATQKQGTANKAIASLHSAIEVSTVDKKDKSTAEVTLPQSAIQMTQREQVHPTKSERKPAEVGQHEDAVAKRGVLRLKWLKSYIVYFL